jgi:peroxiredoxin
MATTEQRRKRPIASNRAATLIQTPGIHATPMRNPMARSRSGLRTTLEKGFRRTIMTSTFSDGGRIVLGLREGQKLLDVYLPTLGGRWTRVGSLLGRTTLFYLWGTWGKHRQGLKPLQEFFQENHSRLNVVGIAYDIQSPSIPMRYVRKYGVTFPMLLDNYCHLSRLWGVKDVPSLMIVDADGFIERLEKEPTAAVLKHALSVDASIKRTRIFEPPKLPPGDPKIESMLQQVTNLLGRNRPQDAIEALKLAAKVAPDNKIIAAQVDVLQHPDRYFKE